MEDTFPPSYVTYTKNKRSDGEPVSLFPFKNSHLNLFNWPSSAGMGPGNEYKTQSNTYKKHVTLSDWEGMAYGRQVSSSIFIEDRGKEGRRWLPVSWFICSQRYCKCSNFPSSFGMGPADTKTQWKHATNKSSYPLIGWLKGRQVCSSIYWAHIKGKREGGVPVSLFSDKFRDRKLTNWPNSTGMGPANTKHSQNMPHKSSYLTDKVGHTKGKSPLPYWTQIRG